MASWRPSLPSCCRGGGGGGRRRRRRRVSDPCGRIHRRPAKIPFVDEPSIFFFFTEDDSK